MLRYLRLYLNFMRFSFSRAMHFRFDFFYRIFMDVIFYAVNIATIKVIYLHTNDLGGWTEDQTMVFIAAYLLIDAIFMTVFSANLWWLPTFVNRGDLDYYLVRPVSSFFFLLLREFSANSFVNLLMTFGILAWALNNYQGQYSVADLFMYALLILNGAIVHVMANLLFVIPVFWTHSARGLNALYFNLSRFAEKPDRIYAGGMRLFLTTVLPIALIASYPARLFLEGFTWPVFLHIVVVSALFYLLIAWVWRLGLRHYSSASS